MSTDEQFARRLRFEADDVPAIPVDAQRILQTGRRRRQLRPVIGGAAGALGIAVAIAAFSALQPSPTAIGPAGPGATATPPGPVATATAPSQAVVDDAAAQEEQAKLEALRAELDSRVQSPLATRVTMYVINGTIVTQYEGPNTAQVVSTDCMAANGYTAAGSIGLSPGGPLSPADMAAFNQAYEACVAQSARQDGTTLVVTKP